MTHNNKQYHPPSELRDPFSTSHYPMTTMTATAMDHDALVSYFFYIFHAISNNNIKEKNNFFFVIL